MLALPSERQKPPRCRCNAAFLANVWGIPDAEPLANVWISAFGRTWCTNNTREENSERAKRQIGVTPAVHTFGRRESRRFQLWHVVSLLLISIPAHG